MDLQETAVGERIECLMCGETLVRTNITDGSSIDYREVASHEEHLCWSQLPEKAEHWRLD